MHTLIRIPHQSSQARKLRQHHTMPRHLQNQLLTFIELDAGLPNSNLQLDNLALDNFLSRGVIVFQPPWAAECLVNLPMAGAETARWSGIHERIYGFYWGGHVASLAVFLRDIDVL